MVMGMTTESITLMEKGKCSTFITAVFYEGDWVDASRIEKGFGGGLMARFTKETRKTRIEKGLTRGPG